MSWRQADSTRIRLGCEDQPPIGTQLREGLPCLDDGPRSSSHYIGIRQQTKQPHLGYLAEGDGSVPLCGEPVARRHVVNVALSGERNLESLSMPRFSLHAYQEPSTRFVSFR